MVAQSNCPALVAVEGVEVAWKSHPALVVEAAEAADPVRCLVCASAGS